MQSGVLDYNSYHGKSTFRQFWKHFKYYLIKKQYGKLFEMEGVEVDFRRDALQAIALRAMKRKTGARGLRSILESVLLDTMYKIPSQENVAKVVIDASVISGDSEPLIVYGQTTEPKTAAADDA